MTKPIVSILMPVKNAANFLEECLDSIIDQSFTAWELIAVNDHSSDNSMDLLQEYRAIDHRIKALESKGKGIIDALQTAYSSSKGAFITRMDADDIMCKEKIERLLRNLETSGEGSVSTACVSYFSKDQLGDGYKKYESWMNGLMENGGHYNEIYKECVIPSPCWMMYRSDFEKIGGFDSNRSPEDYDLCFRMYEHSLSIIADNKRLHKWRDHGSRASRNDPNYMDNRFLDIKIHYFLKLEATKERRIVLWGAGKKAKYLAKALIQDGIDFLWISNNPKKINHQIYNQLVKNSEEIIPEANDLYLIAIANPNEQINIKKKLLDIGKSPGKDYFFFC